MSNEIATSKDFQEKMFDRIRGMMGDLLTESDLKKIVEVSVQKAFFEKRLIEEDRYGRKTEKEPLFLELIRNELSATIRKAADKWLVEHTEEVARMIDKIISEGFFGIILGELSQRIQGPMQEFARQLQAKGVLH